MNKEHRNHMILHDPLSKVIPKLAVPSIVSMLITSIYNMADTFFVSQLDTSASGAVGVIFSAMAIIQALAFTIGMGTGSNVSRLLGAGEDDLAHRFCAIGVITAFLTGIVIAAPALCSIEWLVQFLGATPTITPYAVDYATYIFYAAPFMMASFVMNNILRFQGLSLYGMVGISTGGILNMVLDPILIFGFQLGTAGAAIATAISQVVSFSILLVMCNTRPDAITIRLRNFKPTLAIYGKILYTGMPSMGRQGIASVANILLNKAAGVYGDAAIAALSIVGRIVMFINSAVIGFCQGFQPVCGFCYGAGQYTRVRQAVQYTLKVITVMLLVLAGTVFLMATPLVTVFRREDAEVIRIGVTALRMHLCTMPLWGIIIMANMMTQSIGYGMLSTISSVSRQGLCLIPVLLVLSQVLGLTGIQLAQPVSDLFAFVMCLFIHLHVMKQLKGMEDKPLPSN